VCREKDSAINDIKREYIKLAEEIESVSKFLEILQGHLQSVNTSTENGVVEIIQAFGSIRDKNSELLTKLNDDKDKALSYSHKNKEQLDHSREIIGKVKSFLKDRTKQIVEDTKKVESVVVEVRKLTKFTRFIQDVADQTNLLALNASVEAAHAGNAGRGFRVIAKRIRDLSVQISTSVKEIETQFLYIIDHVEKNISSIVESSHTSEERRQMEEIAD